MISDVSRGVQGGTIASAVEEFGLALQSTLTQIEVLRTVLGDAVDLQSTKFLHELGHVSLMTNNDSLVKR